MSFARVHVRLAYLFLVNCDLVEYYCLILANFLCYIFMGSQKSLKVNEYYICDCVTQL